VGSKVQWTKPKIDPMEIARRLDEAMYEMEQASGKVRLIMERSGGRGSDEGMVEIQSANRYNIDWFRTDKFGMIFKSRANGKVRRELQDQGWGPISPLPATWTKDEALTDEWSTFFPKLIFRPVIEKKPIWVPLISSLRKQGYTVALGSRNAELPDGRTRVLYQFECTSKNPKHFQITARFDGQRLVPLTVNLKRGATTYRWTAEWAFNQKVDDKMFEIVETPVNAESPKTP